MVTSTSVSAVGSSRSRGQRTFVQVLARHFGRVERVGLPLLPGLLADPVVVLRYQLRL
jgi:hypothetical protein